MKHLEKDLKKIDKKSETKHNHKKHSSEKHHEHKSEHKVHHLKHHELKHENKPEHHVQHQQKHEHHEHKHENHIERGSHLRKQEHYHIKHHQMHHENKIKHEAEKKAEHHIKHKIKHHKIHKKHKIHHAKHNAMSGKPLILPSDKDERNQDMRSKTDKKPTAKKMNLKNVPTLQLRDEKEIAMDFATKVYQKFNKIIKSVIQFGSTVKQETTSGSDIDIIIILDDATIRWDQELISWYREELEKLVKANPYPEELHVNTIKLTTWWDDLLRGDGCAEHNPRRRNSYRLRRIF